MCLTSRLSHLNRTLYLTWCIHVCFTTHSCAWHCSWSSTCTRSRSGRRWQFFLICVTWLIYVQNMPGSCAGQTLACAWHDSCCCAWTHERVHADLYVRMVCMRMHVCMYAYMYFRMNICMYVCILDWEEALWN